MDPFDRFLTLLLKELKNSGFVETIRKYADHFIKEGFEILAEIAVELLKTIISRCFSCFGITWSNFKKPSENPIFYIIYNLINEFELPDFETIIRYIKGAIGLLMKLLTNFYKFFKKPARRPTNEMVLYEEMPLIHCRSCSSCNVNTNIPSIEAMSLPLAETKNTSPTKTTGYIVGTKKIEGTSFKGAERKISYYVGHVCLTASEQDIIDFLTDAIPDGYFECIKLKSKEKMQSFKVTANWLSKKGLENPKNWPEGVMVRPWVEKDKKPLKALQNGIEVS